MSDLKGKFYIIPYVAGSESVELLCEKLGILATKIDGKSKAIDNPNGKLFMYWGKPPSKVVDQISNVSYHKRVTVRRVNDHSNIHYAVNKRDFFNMISSKPYCLENTTDPALAYSWVADDECRVIARSTVTGMGGEGIKVIRSVQDWKDMGEYHFFTKYVPKRAEYRIHVFDNKVVACSRRVMRSGEQPKDLGWEVRSHDNGFIFQLEDLANVPKECIDAAVDATNTCGLLVAGADVLWNERNKKAYVCELNSAPGIEGSAVEAYAKAIRSYLYTNYKLGTKVE